MNATRNFCWMLTALAATLSGAAALAQVAPPGDMLGHLAPSDRPGQLQRLIARQRAAPSPSAVDIDTTPPVLTAFNAGGTLNLAKAAVPFKVFMKATDDLSGVQNCYAYATGPSGQTVYVYLYPGFPATTVSSNGGINQVSRLLEPGTWTFNYAYCYDVAGNYGYADAPALQALGNTSFTVVNKSGYDLAKPALVGGKILSGPTSLSGHAPGTTDKNPYVGVKLDVTDAGNSALSGVKTVYAYFCKLSDSGTCIYLYGYVYATGLASATVSATTQVSAANGNVPGTYELQSVYVYDHAGNQESYTSTLFGGTTDFSAMFPATVIKLKP